ncbi:ATP-binding protein [Candidatus Sumerlaeota bacterium]|nr:ATP-binding protein [Candidatus Sumerlaeota bacterium]
MIAGHDNLTVLALESDPNAWKEFYHAVEKSAELVIYPTLEGLLSDDPRSSNTIILLDLDDLYGSPTALVAQLVDRRSRQRMGITSGREVESNLMDLRRWGILHATIKLPPINEEEVALFLDCVRNPANGFGLSRYLTSTMEMYSLPIETFEEKNHSIERVINHFATAGFEIHELFDVRLILEEALNNAFFHAFRNEKGEEKYQLGKCSRLDPGDRIRVEYGNNGNLAGFAVMDNAGQLSLRTIFDKLERQYNKEGVFDERGRGLYLSRLMSSRVIFSLEPGKRTQLIALFDETRRQSRPKPFFINVIGEENSRDFADDLELD